MSKLNVLSLAICAGSFSDIALYDFYYAKGFRSIQAIIASFSSKRIYILSVQRVIVQKNYKKMRLFPSPDKMMLYYFPESEH